MQSRTLINIGLLSFLIALLSSIFFSPGNKENNDSKKITTIDKSSINKITIPRKAGDIILIKKNSQWFMHSPHTVRAHTFRINSLLNLLELESNNYYATDNLDLKTYNLDEPVAKIIFNETIIEYGKTNPVNHKRFLKVNNKLFLVDDSLYPLIRSQPTSFVDLALFSKTDKIQKITLPELTIFKDKHNTWKTSPEDIASADDIQNLLQNWQLAKAFGVHAYMPRKNLGAIEIVLQNGEAISLEITDKEPWLILAHHKLGIEYHLDNSYTKRILSIENNP